MQRSPGRLSPALGKESTRRNRVKAVRRWGAGGRTALLPLAEEATPRAIHANSAPVWVHDWSKPATPAMRTGQWRRPRHWLGAHASWKPTSRAISSVAVLPTWPAGLGTEGLAARLEVRAVP